tara:strand:- start:113 stop:295 length:183 start_codon:yes stop_codon:yes gene_type:complete
MDDKEVLKVLVMCEKFLRKYVEMTPDERVEHAAELSDLAGITIDQLEPVVDRLEVEVDLD